MENFEIDIRYATYVLPSLNSFVAFICIRKNASGHENSYQGLFAK